MKFLVLVLIFSTKLGFIATECLDIYGRSIPLAAHYIPGPDICQLCVCDNTGPKWCKRVLCSPPQNCKSFVMGSSCCDYSCLDNSLPTSELRDEIDRRFLITIATAFLILTALLFVIHKLRHRSIHGHLPARHQMNEDRRSIGSIGFITGSIGYLNLPNAHHFDDHPLVHFPLYKPNGYFPRGDAPPPYDEAMADARLASYTEIEMISGERSLRDANQQRRRSHSAFLNQSRIGPHGNYIPHSSGVIVDNSSTQNNYSTQHRTIPLPLDVNKEHENIFTNMGSNNRSCTLHKKNNVNSKKNEMDHHRGRANSTNQRQSHASEGSQLDVTSPFQSRHRSIPLSVSLSSPLPSTSDYDGQGQFSGVSSGPTSSSASEICSTNRDEQHTTQIKPQKSQHKSCKKSSDVSETKSSNERKVGKILNEESTYSNSIEKREESPEICPIVEDYYAECENCNLNVDDGCDGSEEYFSQETMTLERKLHEISSASTMDKVSLTLPTNSKTRHRCHSKKLWNTKESPFKATLEYVSSEEEDEGRVEIEVDGTGNQELSKNTDENTK